MVWIAGATAPLRPSTISPPSVSIVTTTGNSQYFLGSGPGGSRWNGASSAGLPGALPGTLPDAQCPSARRPAVQQREQPDGDEHDRVDDGKAVVGATLERFVPTRRS